MCQEKDVPSVMKYYKKCGVTLVTRSDDECPESNKCVWWNGTKCRWK